MTNEGGTTYSWNDANQITAAAGVNYTYDGNMLRVKKSNGKLYWRGAGFSTLAESDLSGNTTLELIYFAGRGVGLRDAATGNVYYSFGDQVGSTRVLTDANGVVCYDADYYAFGGENVKVATCPQAYKFTGYERDPETGLDYAVFRYYNSRVGRFMSPDPIEGDVGDPQSLNRYTYVVNDPVNLTDPLGLWEDCGDPGFADSHAQCAELPGPWGGGIWIVIGGGWGGGGGGSGGGGGGGIGGSIPNGESLGIPTGLKVKFPGLWGTLLPIDPQCEFGPCVPIGNGFGAQVVVVGGVACLSNPACVTLVVITVAAVYYYGPQILKGLGDVISSTIDPYNELLRDFKNCIDAYPPGPARERCFEAARQKFRISTGKPIPGPKQ